MKATSFGALAVAAVFQASLAAAQTSLYIPGFDPQALTVDVQGVDAQGRTTYVFGPGVTSGTFEDPAGIVGSATLVADATEAHLVYANTELAMSISEDCAIANGQAVCSGVVSAEGTQESILVTETVTPFAVQAGATAAASSGSGAATQGAGSGSGSAAASTPTAGSGVSSGPSQTGAGSGASASATAPAGNNNGVGKVGTSMGLALGVAGLVSAFFL